MLLLDERHIPGTGTKTKFVRWLTEATAAINFALIKQLVYANCGTMDHYLPGLMSVIYTETTPLDAILKIESGQ